MKRYNIAVPRNYIKDGEEKTTWSTVGTLVRFPATETKSEGYIMELGMFPNTTFKIFEQKERNEKPKQETIPEVNYDDIPFD